MRIIHHQYGHVKISTCDYNQVITNMFWFQIKCIYFLNYELKNIEMADYNAIKCIFESKKEILLLMLRLLIGNTIRWY